MRHLSSLAVLLVLLQEAAVTIARPLQVFLLAGQSNMVGMGSMDHLDLLIRLNYVPTNEYKDTLCDEKGYRVRDDVFITFDDDHGNLTVDRNSGFSFPDHFGPEIMIGWALGDALGDKVLLIKTAWGGSSLAVDFRPPRSGQGNHTGVLHQFWYGNMYKRMITDILRALEKVAPLYYDDEHQSYELLGFVWFQGWNDMLNWDTVNEYQENLANLIRDVRQDLDAPGLPVIIGELGMHGVAPQGYGADKALAMREHELAVTMMDEFRNNTLYVPTAEYAVQTGELYDGAHHYFGKYLVEKVALLVESSLTLIL
jgi:hypothetical protein